MCGEERGIRALMMLNLCARKPPGGRYQRASKRGQSRGPAAHSSRASERVENRPRFPVLGSKHVVANLLILTSGVVSTVAVASPFRGVVSDVDPACSRATTTRGMSPKDV